MIEDTETPILGFRAWHVWWATGQLLSITMRETGWGQREIAWEPGVNTARCDHGHHAPQGRCTCGLYAYHQLEAAAAHIDGSPQTKVYGAVAAWGEIEVHADGVRAEHARVLALTDAAGVAGPMRGHWDRWLPAVAARYGALYIPDAADLLAFMHEHGRFLGSDEIPAAIARRHLSPRLVGRWR